MLRTRRTAGAWLLAPVIALALALAGGGTARADVVWLCHPGIADDPCEIPLDTTVQRPDATTVAETPARPPADRRPVDCFYVYPTVSNQLALNATKAKDPEIRAVAKYQAARFSSVCRMFAPVYRQATSAGVAGAVLPPTAEIAYTDVREAWRRYLAEDNGGRGVILLGHSQGAIMLRTLIRREIDRDPAARRRLVGAFLFGGNVTVRAGQAAGGDFSQVPLCTRRGEYGCVVAYSTFSTDPSPLTFFGNTDTDVLGAGFGLPHGPGYEVACTDPGVLSGLGGPFGLTIPTESFPPGVIATGVAITANGPIPTAPTTWVESQQYAGSCRTINGAHVFRYDPVGASRHLAEFPPAWGTHLVDFNLGVERLTTIARLQAQAWLDAGFAIGRVRADRRTGGAVVRIAVPAAGRLTLVAAGAVRRRTLDVGRPAEVTVRLVPTARARRLLARGHGPRRTLTVTFTPAGGTPLARSARLRLVRRRG